jgi:hypothetical protein
MSEYQQKLKKRQFWGLVLWNAFLVVAFIGLVISLVGGE